MSGARVSNLIVEDNRPSRSQVTKWDQVDMSHTYELNEYGQQGTNGAVTDTCLDRHNQRWAQCDWQWKGLRLFCTMSDKSVLRR